MEKWNRIEKKALRGFIGKPIVTGATYLCTYINCEFPAATHYSPKTLFRTNMLGAHCKQYGYIFFTFIVLLNIY